MSADCDCPEGAFSWDDFKVEQAQLKRNRAVYLVAYANGVCGRFPCAYTPTQKVCCGVEFAEFFLEMVEGVEKTSESVVVNGVELTGPKDGVVFQVETPHYAI